MKQLSLALCTASLMVMSAGCQLNQTESTISLSDDACDPIEKGTTMVERDGLKYEILTESSNETTAKSGQQVTVHYTGWLDNNGKAGKKFDSSVDRGETFTFGLGMGCVIQGWDKGVAGMRIGEKRRLYIPSEMGYGDRGAGGAIPPGASLIFDIEVLAFQ